MVKRSLLLRWILAANSRERVLFHMKILSQCWHVSNARKKMVLRVCKVVIRVLRLAITGGKSPGSCFRRKIVRCWSRPVHVYYKSPWQGTIGHYSGQNGGPENGSRTKNLRIKRKNSEDGVNSSETDEWNAALVIGTNTKAKMLVTPKSSGNPRHAQTHDGKLEGTKTRR